MYAAKRRLELELKQMRARLQAAEAGRAGDGSLQTIASERDRMRRAGQQLIARMKEERDILRQWEARARAEREARLKIAAELERARGKILEQRQELEELRRALRGWTRIAE